MFNLFAAAAASVEVVERIATSLYSYFTVNVARELFDLQRLPVTNGLLMVDLLHAVLLQGYTTFDFPSVTTITSTPTNSTSGNLHQLVLRQKRY